MTPFVSNGQEGQLGRGAGSMFQSVIDVHRNMGKTRQKAGKIRGANANFANSGAQPPYPRLPHRSELMW